MKKKYFRSDNRFRSPMGVVACLMALICSSLTACLPAQEYTKEEVQFDHIVRNPNGEVVVMGESFEQGVRQGEWRSFDLRGKLIRIEHYRNDTLTGMAQYYRRENADHPSREEGLMVKGKRSGLWVTSEKQAADHWRPVMHTVYGPNEVILSKCLFHPNGQTALEIFMDQEGQGRYFKKYDAKGKLIYQGEALPEIIE